MKSLFDQAVVVEVKTRLGELQPQSIGLWGKMTVSQMLAHCALGLEWAVGDAVPGTVPFLFRLIGRLIKPKMLQGDAPMKKNSPTSKDLIVGDQRDFGAERDRLSALIDRFAEGGAAGCTGKPHPFFGPLTPDEWAILGYKHLDHHLRQFGV